MDRRELSNEELNDFKKKLKLLYAIIDCNKHVEQDVIKVLTGVKKGDITKANNLKGIYNQKFKKHPLFVHYRNLDFLNKYMSNFDEIIKNLKKLKKDRLKG